MQNPVFGDIPLLRTVLNGATGSGMQSVRLLHVPRRAALFKAGDKPSGLYVVVSGAIKLSLPLHRGREKVVALLEPGHSFGISALLVNEPHMVTAAAARESTVAHLETEHVRRAMRRDPEFAQQIAVELSRAHCTLLDDLQMTAGQSALERTATFLARQVPRSDGHRRISITLPANKGDIASRLNLTGAHFSRILRELEGARLIRLEGSTISIPDPQRLCKAVLTSRAAPKSSSR